MDNRVTMIFTADGKNEAFARNAVAAFIIPLNPTVEELNDVKTAVSEAVTNAIVHGYEGRGGEVSVGVAVSGRTVHISVSDLGVGIENVEQARKPFFTTKADGERSGMGFTVMECVMDSVEVTGRGGTTVAMTKELK